MGLTLSDVRLESIAEISQIPTLHQCGAEASLDYGDSIEVQFSELLSGPAGVDEAARLQGLFTEFRNHITSQLIGREELVDCVLAGLVSGVPVSIFGPPGTAKSACVRLIAKACTSPKGNDGASSEYFEWLVTNHTMPEELFGPPKIDKLEAGVFERNTNGKLPEAEFVFLDEVFRGGGHILNTLLTVINERKFHNGTAPVDVPLVGLVAAANDPPSSPDVEAFYDRFPVRFWVDSILSGIQADEVVTRGAALLNKSASLDLQEGSVNESPHWKLSTNHFRLARHVLSIGESAAQINQQHEDGPTERFEEFMTCFDIMRTEHGISDRSLWRLYRFGCALDWLQGRDMNKSTQESEGVTGHLDVFRYVAATEERSRDARGRVDEFIRGANLHGAN